MNKNFEISYARGLAPVVGLIVIWEAAARLDLFPGDVLVPAFSAVVLEIREMLFGDILIPHLISSLLRVLAGFFAGAVCGILLGIWMGWSPYVRQWFRPIVSLLYPIPALGWLPLLMLWVGVNELLPIAIIFICSFFPILYNTVTGIRQVSSDVLNVIAGLVSYRGRVMFDGLAVDDMPPASRNVGYLFQSFALFPHMTVRENIAFGLKARKTPPASVKKRVDDLCRHLHIEHLTDRYPKFLSGGEKQRVALARTLAPDPGILLLDEPFNSLDQATAGLLRMDLKNLQKQLGLTTIYVTHNQSLSQIISIDSASIKSLA
jgi:ABC-type thiamine transport system ATPase subunit